MGILNSLFGSSDNTTTTSVQYPDWVDNAGQSIWGAASNIAQTPYQSYSAPRIAGMTGDQLSAQSMLRSWLPKELQAGYSGFKSPSVIGEIDGKGTADYMNPYLENVLAGTNRNIRRGADMAHQWGSNVAAHGDGAFGDARHGIADAQIEKDAMLAMGDAANNAYSAAFDNAMGLKSDDISRLFQSAQFNREGQDAVLKYLDSLYRSGQNTQQLQQANADLMYQDFTNQRDYPKQQLQMLISALGGSPYGNSTSQTSPGPSTASSILGAGASLASILAAL